MPLVKAGSVVADDFVRLDADSALPPDTPVLLPHRRLLDDPDILRRGAPTGVVWPNDRKPAELAPHLDRLGLVALVFPTFKDGRAYSQARILREQPDLLD